MDTAYIQIASWCWVALFLVWFFGFFGVKKTIKRPQAGKFMVTTFLIAAGFLLLFGTGFFGPLGFLGVAVSPQNTFFGMVGALLALLGVAFAIWARVTLGRNWSGNLATVKENHQLMQSGPYAIVRHPIYTGFFFAMLGTAFAVGMVASYLGVLLALVAFLARINIEEQVMTQEFLDVYPNYRKKVKALIPFIW